VYTLTLKPIWTYGLQLWGSASNSHLDILERFKSKALRMLTNAPWFVPNAIIRNDIRVTTIRQEVNKNTASPTGSGSLCIPTTWQPPCPKGYLATEDSNGIILKTWSLVLITSMYNPCVKNRSLEIEPKKEMLHWRYLLHDTNTDRHTRVLNVLGQLAPDWGD